MSLVALTCHCPLPVINQDLSCIASNRMANMAALCRNWRETRVDPIVSFSCTLREPRSHNPHCPLSMVIDHKPMGIWPDERSHDGVSVATHGEGNGGCMAAKWIWGRDPEGQING